MTSLKNKWRSIGELQFRRETKRFSDNSPWEPKTDQLWVRIKGKAATCIEPFTYPLSKEQCLSVLAATYYLPKTVIEAAHIARRYLKTKASEPY